MQCAALFADRFTKYDETLFRDESRSPQSSTNCPKVDGIFTAQFTAWTTTKQLIPQLHQTNISV